MFDACKTVQKALPKFLDRPSPLTTKAVQVQKSSKKKMISAVGFASKTFGKLLRTGIPPAEYMARLIKGGTRNLSTNTSRSQPLSRIKTNTVHLNEDKFAGSYQTRRNTLQEFQTGILMGFWYLGAHRERRQEVYQKAGDLYRSSEIRTDFPIEETGSGYSQKEVFKKF